MVFLFGTMASFLFGCYIGLSAISDVRYDELCNDFALYEPQYMQSLTYKKYCKDTGE